MILIPIVLVLFDLCVIVMAVQVNDATCREAARVAAAGNPNDMQLRAQAVVNRANASAVGMCSNFVLANIASTVSPADLSRFTKYGGTVTGTVSVETDVDVRPFVVKYAFSGGKPLQFRSQQSFPFTCVMPGGG
jgi:hypothetical protein